MIPVVFATQWASVRDRAESGRKMRTVASFIKKLKDSGIDRQSIIVTNPFAKSLELLHRESEKEDSRQVDSLPQFERRKLKNVSGVVKVDGKPWVGYRDIEGREVAAIQELDAERRPDGTKHRFKKGSKRVGACFDPLEGYLTPETERALIFEGAFDTFAAIQAYRETGNDARLESGKDIALAASNDGNIPEVVSRLLAARPDLNITIGCDNDKAGLAAAAKVAGDHDGVRFAMPPNGAKDFDQALREAGAAAVVAALQSADWVPEPAAIEGELLPHGEAESRTPPVRGRPRNAGQSDVIAAARDMVQERLFQVYRDEFEDDVFVGWGTESPRPWLDRDTTELVCRLEGLGLRGVDRGLTRWAIDYLAAENQRKQSYKSDLV